MKCKICNPYKSDFLLCIDQHLGEEKISGKVIVDFFIFLIYNIKDIVMEKKSWKSFDFFKEISSLHQKLMWKIIWIHLSFKPLSRKDYKEIFLSMSSIYEVQIIHSLQPRMEKEQSVVIYPWLIRQTSPSSFWLQWCLGRVAGYTQTSINHEVFWEVQTQYFIFIQTCPKLDVSQADRDLVMLALVFLVLHEVLFHLTM